MNCLPTSRSGKRSLAGFTLLEMLTAVAVLAMLMVILGKILGTTSRAWVDGQRKVNNFNKARAMLDIFARDIQSGVFRSDLAFFPGSAISFYTLRPGFLTSGGTVRGVSIVQYGYSSDQSSNTTATTLQRSDMAISWSSAASTMSFGNTSSFGSNTLNPRDTAPGVVCYKAVFVYADGGYLPTYVSNSSNPLCAVGLTLAVVDDQTLKQLSMDQVLALRAALKESAAGTRSVKAEWEDYFRDSSVWNSYPQSLKVGLKIFERYVILPTL